MQTTAFYERFWAKVDKTDECWLWTGAKTGAGYGLIRIGRRSDGALLAHRAAYECIVGPVPIGTELDHLCRTPACVNPAHLEAVSHRENILRAPAYSKSTCSRGHERTPDGVYLYPGGQKRCRACRSIQWQNWAKLNRRKQSAKLIS